MSLKSSAIHIARIVQNSEELKIYQFKGLLRNEPIESHGLEGKSDTKVIIKKACIDGKLIEEATSIICWKSFFGRTLFRDKVLPNIIINLFGGKNGT
jgi:hypothetical protein